MKLAKALKEKNKKAKSLNTLISRMVNNNSRIAGATSAYDSRVLYGQVLEELNGYVQFKTQLFNASAEIREKIFRLGELRSLVQSLKGMTTYNGVVRDRYETTASHYESTISETEKDNLIVALETEIEELQDEIDLFNAKKEI